MSGRSHSYVVRVGDRTYSVLVRPLGENRFKVVVEGEEVEVLVESGGSNITVARPEPTKLTEAGTSPRGYEPSPKSTNRKPETGSGAVSTPATGPGVVPAVVGATIAAPIPGKVLKVLVSPGDSVSPGKLVATLESMKMEVEVFSDKSGRVKEVRVRPGEFVNVGDSLVVLE